MSVLGAGYQCYIKHACKDVYQLVPLLTLQRIVNTGMQEGLPFGPVYQYIHTIVDETLDSPPMAGTHGKCMSTVKAPAP